MSDEQWAPPGVDATKPNVARVYDYAIGGKDNFAVDRELHEMVLRIAPRIDARDSRTFLQRTVRYLAAEAGIRQFLDIGSGLPTQGNVHEIAQDVDPRARVVYVDNDPVVLVHARAILGVTDTTEVITADVRQPDDILDDPAVRDFLDLDQPVALLLLAVMHHVADEEDPARIVGHLRDALAPGSYLALSHFSNPGPAQPESAALATETEKLFSERLGTGRFRTHEEIVNDFGDFSLVEPGLVPLLEWRPDLPPTAAPTSTYHTFVGGVARKPD